MARAIWKGAISFGLVHIPVAVVSATSSENVDFDWLDSRSMEPVGYKRINKVTGKEVKKENIVKGVQYEKGKYVVLSEEEIRTAHPASTQTIDIFSFVASAEIPLTNIDTPYYLAPDKRGEKVYALLRETLLAARKVALANVILHSKQHLAALMPMEGALVLVLLRWPAEVRDIKALELTSVTTDAKLTKSEKEMAQRLVQDMTHKWNPKDYRDSFQEKIMALVEKKARQGKIENVEKSVEPSSRKSADILDLTELLKRSLGGKAITPSTKRTAKISTPDHNKVKPLKPKVAAKKTKSAKSPVTKSKTSPKAAAPKAKHK